MYAFVDISLHILKFWSVQGPEHGVIQRGEQSKNKRHTFWVQYSRRLEVSLVPLHDSYPTSLRAFKGEEGL